jgi:acyl-coenzyme A thioesterase PaaI-like protein
MVKAAREGGDGAEGRVLRLGGRVVVAKEKSKSMRLWVQSTGLVSQSPSHQSPVSAISINASMSTFTLPGNFPS